MLNESPLICEYFDSNCVEGETTKCHENKTCSSNDDSCFTAWTMTNANHYENVTNESESITHPSGYDVKRMGCINTLMNVHKCTPNCEQTTELTQRHGYLFCCCTGDYCNSNFTYNPPTTPQPQSSTTVAVTTDDPSNSIIKKSKYTPVTMHIYSLSIYFAT